MRPRGLSHLRTSQMMTSHSRPATRAQIASQLARTEHEMMRLRREHQVWMQKAKQTAERLAMAEAQAEKLSGLLTEMRATRPKDVFADGDVDAIALEY